MFDAKVYILSKEEGGRHTPFYDNYRPQFYFRTTDVTGVVNLPEGTEMVMPGDKTEMKVDLIQPIAMEEGSSSPSVRAVARLALAGSSTSSSELTHTHYLKWGPGFGPGPTCVAARPACGSRTVSWRLREGLARTGRST